MIVTRNERHEWTPKRQQFVRDALRRGDNRQVIAERLGLTLRALHTAIHRLGLNKGEAA